MELPGGAVPSGWEWCPLLNYSANPEMEEEVEAAAVCLSLSALGGENPSAGLIPLNVFNCMAEPAGPGASTAQAGSTNFTWGSHLAPAHLWDRALGSTGVQCHGNRDNSCTAKLTAGCQQSPAIKHNTACGDSP